MNLADITTKCYILALIIRDDGERLLLGDGAYEFKDSQQHFIANTYANDVVELQGTDGQMLAGQVRRTAVQTFAGYIGDATFSKQKVESARRDFLMFFRKKHYYTAVYVFSDGTAIQRKRGYIVNAPSAPELYQRYPEWSIGLNFEDPNYYEYAEDEHGDEIAAHLVQLELSTAMSGGLIWDGDGAVSDDLSYVGTEIAGEGKNFQLTETGTAALKSAELLGDAEQTTYSGKNLFNLNATPTLGRTTVSVSGQSVTVTTDATASTARATFPIEYEANREMTVSFDATCLTYEPTASNTVIVYMRTTGQSDATTQITLDKTVGTTVHYTRSFTPNNDTKDLWFYLKSSNIAGVVSYRFDNVQIEYGASETAYEPYVGGTASPNPDYPQEVNTVTGEQTVEVVGKNLLSADEGTYSRSGITGVVSNGELTLNGTSTAVSSMRFGAYRLIPAGTYTLSANNPSSETGTSLLRLVDPDGIAPTAMACSLNNADATKTFTLSEDTWLAYQWRFDSGKTLANFTIKPQLELGSTATAYEPYQGQVKTVNLGKNLIYTGDRTNQGITFAYNATTGETSVSGTASTTYANALQISEYLPAGTYTVSIQDTLPFTVGIGTRNSANTRTPHGITAGNKSLTFILTEPAFSYDVYLTALTSGSQINATFKLQVERGSTATSFAPYFTPIELAKIGTYQDRIYKQGDDWFVHKEIGKITEATNFDNSVNVGDGTYRFYLTNAGSEQSASTVLATSSRFVGIPYSERNSHQGQSWVFANGNIAIQVPSTIATTLTTFKDWWNNNPTTVYYALATPTTTEITNSELVEQLERLQHAHTYANITNFSITATSPNLPAYLKVVAFGDDAIPQGGYVWEDGGTGGATTITVDGVDNAQPIWTVVGPATNPSLTNITTGESIQWTGVVPNGQTLVVNMADMTASLSGANVFEFISGSWITLQAGNNRVSYSATAATGIATLEWNGVVG